MLPLLSNVLLNSSIVYAIVFPFTDTETAIQITVATITILALLPFLPGFEQIHRLVFECRSINTLTAQEHALIRDVWTAVVAKARPRLNCEPKLYWMDKKAINCYALGTSTVVVTRGILQVISRHELAGVLSHELGHIAHRDSLKRSISISISLVVRLLLWLLIKLVELVRLVHNHLFNDVTLRVVHRALHGLATVFIKIQAGINMLALYTGRKQEFRADRFAKEIGTGDGLARFLSRIREQSGERGVLVGLKRSHPMAVERARRLVER